MVAGLSTRLAAVSLRTCPPLLFVSRKRCSGAYLPRYFRPPKHRLRETNSYALGGAGWGAAPLAVALIFQIYRKDISVRKGCKHLIFAWLNSCRFQPDDDGL